jgi:hypothetical protein
VLKGLRHVPRGETQCLQVDGMALVVEEVVVGAKSKLNDVKRNAEDNLPGVEERRKVRCLKTRTPLVEVEVAGLN